MRIIRFPSTTRQRHQTRFVEVGGRKLAYRSVGKGKPIVLCHRFRGVLDLWDPAFIDSLTAEGFQVVTFDYSGLGQSTGEKSYNPASLVQDAKDLIDALGLRDVVIGGWSIGGLLRRYFWRCSAPMSVTSCCSRRRHPESS
jgi:pimeloyl-ACP methyl ester carboxylesterase